MEGSTAGRHGGMPTLAEVLKNLLSEFTLLPPAF